MKNTHPYLIQIALLILVANFANAALLQSLHCEVNTQVKETTTNNPLEVTIIYSNAQNAPQETTISCGNDVDKTPTCTHNEQSQNGTCKTTCTYEKGGQYQINARVSIGDCGSSKIEVLEVNEQTFTDNSYLDFLMDNTNAQINPLKIISTPAIVRSDKVQEINITTRNRVEITNAKCSNQNNTKNACACEIIISEKTRSHITCKFNPPLQTNYAIKMTTTDKKEKTFSIILTQGQVANIYAPQNGIDLGIISAIIIAILLIAGGAFYFLKKLDAQINRKDELLAERVKIKNEIDNLKKSNNRGEITDEDLELMLTQKNTELEAIEEQIKTEEAKLTGN